MRIEFIGFKMFPPFKDGIIEFPESTEKEQGEVHLITGENGSGKTRLLCGLAAACGNSKDLDARYPINGGHKLFVGIQIDDRAVLFQRSSGEFLEFEGRPSYLQYASDLNSNQSVNSSSVAKRWHNRSNFASTLNLPFSAQAYRGSARINDQKIAALSSVKASDPASYLSFDRDSSDDEMICQSMANLKLGAAMEYQSGAPHNECRSIKITERFESAISSVTGRSFSFQVRPQPEIHLVARWGKDTLQLSLLPDGLRSIIAWLVACIAKLDTQFPAHPDPLDIPLILLIDEPETHLHPAWQRHLIPAAQKLFPNSQIFVATHSPFVISSVNVGWIHILRIGEDGLVSAEKPIECSKGDSYIDVVEDVLGVKQIYDPETEVLLRDFREMKANVAPLGTTSLTELEAKAEVIASRSESLKGIMAREVYQLRRNTKEGQAVHEDAQTYTDAEDPSGEQ